MSAPADKDPGSSSQGGEIHLIGSKLLAAKLVTEAQLMQALERQKTRGEGWGKTWSNSAS